jgi:uncharacterized protein YbjQ (UPF0145 family)
MTTPPPAASAAFDSGLTTPDFAACLSMGLQPVGLVQGFFCGQVSGWSNYRASITRRYGCAHGYVGNEHPPPDWLGVVDSLDQAWRQAHQVALQRLLAEATARGAHGVVGVTTEFNHPTSQNSCEAHLYGTAVRRTDGPAPPAVWSTQLAGHKLAKLVEAGFAPQSVLYARATSVLAEGCNMEFFKQGRCYPGETVTPLRDLHHQARQLTLQQASSDAGAAALYGVRMAVHEHESGQYTYVTCTLLGSAVRKVRHTLPLAHPVATVTLSDG